MKPKASRPIDTNKISGFDICQSPPHVIEPLLPLLDIEWTIWESAAGPEKLLRKALCTHGYNVIGTDLLYGEEFNYFTYTPTFHYDVEVTNVPFSLKYLWIQRAMQRDKPFALLVPYETGAAGKLQLIAAKYDTVFQILAPERRIAFKMPDMGWGKHVFDKKKDKEVWRDSSAQMPTCWITWKLHADSIYRSTMYLETFAVPMRNVKYNDDNSEKV